MTTIQILSNSCDNREIEMFQIERYLESNGVRVIKGTEPSRHADFIVVSSCAVAQRQEDRSMSLIQQSLKLKSGDFSRVIVCGCLPKINEQRLLSIFEGRCADLISSDEIGRAVGIRISSENLSHSSPISFLPGRSELFGRLVVLIMSALNHKLIWRVVYAHKNLIAAYVKLLRLGPRKVLGIQIQTGCNSDCSYCAIPRSTGRVKSQRSDEIISIFEDGLSQGFNDFMLSGECIDSYGMDTGESLPNLLRKIFRIDKPLKLVINNLGPEGFLEAVDPISCLLKKGKIRSILLPVQSGNRRVLGLMRRTFDQQAVIACIKNMRKISPFILGTAVIAGFPTESRDEFSDTIGFCAEAGFNYVKIFGYSDRPDTEASKIKEKIPKKEIDFRLRRFKSILGKKMAVEIIDNPA